MLGVPEMDVKKINASSENGIDTIRNKIMGHVETLSLSGKTKIVLLEEADRLSQAAQMALRDVTESFTDVARFIFTCNYVEKIIPALHSRFQHVHIDAFDSDALITRIAYILEQEQVKVDNIDYVWNHVNQFAPDLRKIINSIQQSSKTGTLKDVAVGAASSDVVEQWQQIWKTAPNRAQLEPLALLADNTNFDAMMRIAYENAERLGGNSDRVILLASNYLDRASRVADMQILMHAFVIHLFSELP